MESIEPEPGLLKPDVPEIATDGLGLDVSVIAIVVALVAVIGGLLSVNCTVRQNPICFLYFQW